MLINCPECGHIVSDKAEICPNCGIKIAGNITAELPKDDETKESGQENDGNDGNKGNGRNGYVTLLVILVVTILICGTAYYIYERINEGEETNAYAEAIQSKDTLLLESFLLKYKDAPQEHKDSITTLLNTLREEENDWQSAKASGSREIMQRYIDEHPRTSHALEAESILDSLDYIRADRKHTKEAYEGYLTLHPNGKYALLVQDAIDDEKKKEANEEETTMARSACKRFFQAINAKDEDKLLETVSEPLTPFLGKAGATKDDVVTFMNKIYKSDFTNMNFYIQDDFTLTKDQSEDGTYSYKAHFTVLQKIERKEDPKQKEARFGVTMGLTPDFTINKLSMERR